MHTRLLVVLALITPLLGQSADTFVLRHANVIDGLSNSPLTDVNVVIAGGKITGIGKRVIDVPADAQIIELRGKWLLPGYIDAHVHLGDLAAARTALRLGATTVRTMHCEHFVDVQIRDQHRKGQSDLPDVIAAGYQIRPDMFPAFFEDFPELADMRERIAGVEGVRRVVRALVSRGVDHIKFLATERAGTPETDPRKRTFPDEEIDAILDEARKAGLNAAAHAHGEEGALAAVKAGVHSVEHGTFLSDSTLTSMRQKKIFFVPTFTGGSQVPSRPQDRDNPILLERRRVSLPLRNRLTLLAHRQGVPLAAGTDLRYTTTELSMADEALYLRRAGLPIMEVIKIMTAGSARCLGIENRTGAIQRGFEADLVVLDRNPLTDPGALKDINMIINDGKIAFRRATE